MMLLLRNQYNFRYNSVMKYVEYQPKEKDGTDTDPWSRG